jgi:hypothetical protein
VGEVESGVGVITRCCLLNGDSFCKIGSIPPTSCGSRSPHICWKTAMIFEQSRSVWDSDVKTTMNYTHVLNRGGREVRSPADKLF